MHGSFSRADTWNFMALAGPDLKTGFIDVPGPSGRVPANWQTPLHK